MAQKKKVELTRLQGGIAIASFSSGVTIAAVCLFFIPPLGEIASSAVSIVSELLVLCGAILGVKASYDVKFRKFEAELRDVREHETQPTTYNLNPAMKPPPPFWLSRLFLLLVVLPAPFWSRTVPGWR